MFEQLPDIYFDSSKHEQDPSVEVSNINATIMKEENDEDKEIQLSLSAEEIIDKQNKDTFCRYLRSGFSIKQKKNYWFVTSFYQVLYVGFIGSEEKCFSQQYCC